MPYKYNNTKKTSLQSKKGGFLMPSYKRRITVYPEETLLKKAEYLSQKEGRSLSNYIQKIIKEKIEEYENKKGVISI